MGLAELDQQVFFRGQVLEVLFLVLVEVEIHHFFHHLVSHFVHHAFELP